jgi:hypothetical protein
MPRVIPMTLRSRVILTSDLIWVRSLYLFGLKVCDQALVAQVPALDGQFLDLFPFCENFWFVPEVDVSWRQVTEALVIAVVVVMLDKGGSASSSPYRSLVSQRTRFLRGWFQRSILRCVWGEQPRRLRHDRRVWNIPSLLTFLLSTDGEEKRHGRRSGQG